VEIRLPTVTLTESGSLLTGAWSAEESDRLKTSVLELGILFGKSLEDTANGIQWSVIANKMNNTRSPAQCRIKW
jgi:hypothetical protein